MFLFSIEDFRIFFYGTFSPDLVSRVWALGFRSSYQANKRLGPKWIGTGQPPETFESFRRTSNYDLRCRWGSGFQEP